MLLNPLQSRLLIQDALENGYAVLAVNADSPAAITDCLEAARICQSPIIIETSLWQLTGHSFGFGDPILGMARYLAQIAVLAESHRYRDLPIVYHTDHIKGPQTLAILKAAIRGVPTRIGGTDLRLSASTVSLDSSELSEEQNIELLCELCAEATAADCAATLEMEAGVDAGVTPLEVAERLIGAVEKRHPGFIHLWAPGVGTQHGFSDGGYPTFSTDAIRAHRELAHRLTGRQVGIALHGSSGLSNEHLQAAVAAGVIKVNWSSESLLIRSQAARDYFTHNQDRFDKKHPHFKATAMDHGLQSYISGCYIPHICQKIRLLGGEGRAACIERIAGRPLPSACIE